jgi:hypothetical protein
LAIFRELSFACAKIMFMLKFIARTQGTGYLIPGLISFEERMKHGFLDATAISTAISTSK